jgi:hypothetical protein
MVLYLLFFHVAHKQMFLPLLFSSFTWITSFLNSFCYYSFSLSSLSFKKHGYSYSHLLVYPKISCILLDHRKINHLYWNKWHVFYFLIILYIVIQVDYLKEQTWKGVTLVCHKTPFMIGHLF